MSDFKKIISILKKDNNYRKRISTESPQDSSIKVSGKILNNFSSNNYLNLSNNKQLRTKLKNNIDIYGIGSGASPLISGYSTAHKNLENRITQLLGFESTLVTNSGYLANVGLINAISEKQITIFQDKGNHSSIIESSRLSKTKLIRYKHLNYKDLELKIKKDKSPIKIIYTDTVFSMTGEQADLVKLSLIAKQNKSLLFIDDAHGFGVLRENKNLFPSSINGLNLDKIKIDAYIGTFGKAVGTFGAFICGSQELINILIQKSKPYIYSTALPPALVQTTLESINMIMGDKKIVDSLHSNIAYFKKLTNELKININNSDTPIQTISIGNPKTVMDICNKAKQSNIFIQGIRYPTVPRNQDLLRINLTSGHSKKQIQSLVEFLNKL
ncbi:MAG: pyridoxal phosphate-dependent aminotransferase family protein [Gammaproteobacteria bacterium]|nr:pyridoxal phosphate-dependent aminotransferase family protein [Gammaproteobacteria bacterium]MBT5405984.1 pyridoxal phosphate-dependent aminotransferase family protein [Gammaproteobacteria bacterium]MBT5643822.1 pyridoxal phosphate-dependent aminotransferase family protein [Gammaproteobacteria bacterium]MBT7236454.1 pyridoxal phosphate-dependent aminotransferase family protein [Gammaproteobacteria bacterium]